MNSAELVCRVLDGNPLPAGLPGFLSRVRFGPAGDEHNGIGHRGDRSAAPRPRTTLLLAALAL